MYTYKPTSITHITEIFPHLTTTCIDLHHHHPPASITKIYPLPYPFSTTHTPRNHHLHPTSTYAFYSTYISQLPFQPLFSGNHRVNVEEKKRKDELVRPRSRGGKIQRHKNQRIPRNKPPVK